jgi:VanZ family protein
MFSRRARIGWAVALATLALVVGAKALVPHPTGPTLGWDKANHAAAFAVLAFTGLFTFRSSARPLFWVSFLLMAFGVGIEIAQLYVPGRSADLADVVADAAGIVLGLAVADTLARRLERRRHPRGPGSGGGPRG